MAFPRNALLTPMQRAPLARHRFFEQILQAILRVIDFSVVKCIILASPGFFRDQLYQYIFEQAVKLDIKVLHENKAKFLLAYASSGHKFALRGACPYRASPKHMAAPPAQSPCFAPGVARLYPLTRLSR